MNFEIKTKRLLIRTLELADINDFLHYRSNPEIVKYQGFNVMSHGEAEHFIKTNKNKEFAKAGEWKQFAIENIELAKLIGDCAIKFNLEDTRIAQIGMTISHLHQKNAYAKEALRGILSYLFDDLGIHRVEEIVDARNTASINLLKSVGFRQEGYFIENIFFKGEWGSEYQFAMLNREWQTIKNLN